MSFDGQRHIKHLSRCMPYIITVWLKEFHGILMKVILSLKLIQVIIWPYSFTLLLDDCQAEGVVEYRN